MKSFFQSWGLLLIALVLGVIAFFITSVYLNNKEQSIREQILGGKTEKTQAVVATKDLGPGETVGSANMAIALVEAEHLSQFAVSPAEFEKYEGQVLKIPLSRGEPLLTHSVVGDEIDRFSELIEPGNRAVTIEVDSLSSNSGLLVVGDFVDIVVSGEFKTAVSEDTTDAYLPLFQKIKVLAIDRDPLQSLEQEYRHDLAQNVKNPENRIDHDAVTLAIDQNDANLLAFAAEVGEIKFFLRNSEDEGVEVPDVVTNSSFNIDSQDNTMTGTYLFMSANSDVQQLKVVQTLTDAVVNQELRTPSYQKSVPITNNQSNLAATQKSFTLNGSNTTEPENQPENEVDIEAVPSEESQTEN